VNILVLFICYTLLPLEPRSSAVAALVLTLGSLLQQAILSSTTAAATTADGDSGERVDGGGLRLLVVEALLLLAVNINGIATYFPTEMVQRQTFRETRKSIENRIQQQQRPTAPAHTRGGSSSSTTSSSSGRGSRALGSSCFVPSCVKDTPHTVAASSSVLTRNCAPRNAAVATAATPQDDVS